MDRLVFRELYLNVVLYAVLPWRSELNLRAPQECINLDCPMEQKTPGNLNCRVLLSPIGRWGFSDPHLFCRILVHGAEIFLGGFARFAGDVVFIYIIRGLFLDAFTHLRQSEF